MVSSADHKVIQLEEFDGPSKRSYGGFYFLGKYVNKVITAKCIQR